MKHILRYCTNNYWRFIKGEDLLQAHCIDTLVDCYPDVLYMHAPNEGRRKPFEQYKAKVLGITQGIPDILVFRSVGAYKGLAVELKFGKNTTTPAQKQVMAKLEKEGWAVFEVRSHETFKFIAYHYMHGSHHELKNVTK